MYTKNWGALAVRGVAAILFGFVAIIWPGITLVILLTLFGAYVLVDGVLALFAALRSARAQQRSWPYILQGIVDIAIGAAVFLVPGLTTLFLLFLIGFWAIFAGITELIAAAELRKEIEGEWLLILSGIVSIIFGAAVIIFPGEGALALVVVIGIFALVHGIINLGLSYRLRDWEHHPPTEMRKAA